MNRVTLTPDQVAEARAMLDELQLVLDDVFDGSRSLHFLRFRADEVPEYGQMVPDLVAAAQAADGAFFRVMEARDRLRVLLALSAPQPAGEVVPLRAAA